MKSIHVLGKWQCCGENDYFKQEILSGWNTSFMQGSCARSLTEPREVSLLVQKWSWGQGTLQYWQKKELLGESLFSSTQGAALLLHKEGEGAPRLRWIARAPLQQLRVCSRSMSSPTQAETLLIYSHGLWGHLFSPMICLSAEGCLATLNYLLFLSSQGEYLE